MNKCLSKILHLLFLGIFIFSNTPVYAINLAESKFVDPEYSKKISMDFKKAQLNDVLKIFSQQSGLNFIAGQDIASKEITLYLDNVPVEEALERILNANSLTYEIQPGSDIFIVRPVQKPEVEVVTRVYPLKYATVGASKLNNTISIGTAATSGVGIGIISALKAVISESGSIVEDPRTNSLIITDVPTQFPAIEQTLVKLDVPVPQILIEVEMLDISKTTGEQIGMKYGATPLTFKGAKRSLFYPWDQNNLIRKNRVTLTADTPEFTTGTLDASGLSFILQFLKSQTDTKNLARPRILTLNNEKAEIQIKTDEAIGLTTQTNASEGGLSSQAVQAERKPTGVFLTVTPQANLVTGEITMAIVPKVIQSRTGGTFEGKTFKDTEERGTQSILRIKSGDTVILGGLLRTDKQTTTTKLPFLGDLPVVGGAFRHKDDSDQERELIIFITPHIVTEEMLAQKSLPNFEPLNREQDIPTSRLEEVDKALAILEKKKL